MSLDGKRNTENFHDEEDYPRRRRTSFPLHRSFSDSQAGPQIFTNKERASRHLTVIGDLTKSSSSNYILHRQPFDWYINKRSVVLDDIEEVLPIVGSLSKSHTRSIYDSSKYFKTSKPEEFKIKTKKSALPLEKKRMLRILMLHGYKMSEEGFKEMTEFLRNEFSDMVEFVYIMAPHITAVPSADTNFRQQHAWWLKTVDFPSVDFKACFDKTLDYMNRIFIEKGPFDGVFGYSQGGGLIAILSNLISCQISREKYSGLSFKFAILVGAKKSEEYDLCKYYDSCSQISLPTLHIFGKRDEVNSCQSSYELTDYFYEPKMFIHDGGHIIPDESKKPIKDFLDAMIES